MNAQFQPILQEASNLAERLRAALAVIATSETALKSIQANQRSLQAELDTLVSSGEFENDGNAAKVSNLNARLQLIPGRVRQIEDQIANSEQALLPLLSEGNHLGNKFVHQCSRYITAKLTDLFKSIIDPSLGSNEAGELASQVARKTILMAEADSAGSIAHPVQVSAAKRRALLAESVILSLNRFPIIVAEHIESTEAKP